MLSGHRLAVVVLVSFVRLQTLLLVLMSRSDLWYLINPDVFIKELDLAYGAKIFLNHIVAPDSLALIIVHVDDSRLLTRFLHHFRLCQLVIGRQVYVSSGYGVAFLVQCNHHFGGSQ